MLTKMNVVIIYDDHTDLNHWRDCLTRILRQLHITFQILETNSLDNLIPLPQTFYILDAEIPQQDITAFADTLIRCHPSSAAAFCSAHCSLNQRSYPGSLYMIN